MEHLRINFNQVFNLLPDGRIEPKAKLRIGGVEISPDLKFGRGVRFGKVDLFEYVGRDLAITKEGNVWIILGYYA